MCLTLFCDKGVDLIEEIIRLNSLYDYYGNLLTENQNKSFVNYYRYDLSLSEIADKLDISRQGVSDNLRRARNELEHYEDILGLYGKDTKINHYINEYKKNLNGINVDSLDKNHKKNIILMEKIIEELR